MHYRSISSVFVFLSLVWPITAQAGVELFSGTIDIVTTSGKGCGGLTPRHDITLALRTETGGVSGYFEGDTISTGRFSGLDPARLPVRYPYPDEFKASGHFLTLVRTTAGIRAELRDRHLAAGVDDCNFDLARMTLTPVATDVAAEARHRRLGEHFEAQLTRAQAFALARAGRYEAALPLYEQALSLAEAAMANSPALLSPYIVGLANAYIKLGVGSPGTELEFAL